MKKEYDFCEENLKRKIIIKNLKEDNIPVVIYGTGKFGKAVANFVAENDISILCFLDKEEYWYYGKSIKICGNTIQCLTKEELLRKKEIYNILIGMIDYSLIYEIRKEFQNCHYIEYLDIWPSHIMSKSFLVQNQEIICEIYDSLCDEESRQVLQAYLYARYSGDVAALSSLRHDLRYLYDWEILALSKDDVVIDGGAYVGDSILEMKEYLGELPAKVFAFEPDKNNAAKIFMNFSDNEKKQISVINAGLYCCDGTMNFSASGTLGSGISENAEDTVMVQALDMHSEFKSATIIKMDIEGCELEALRGGGNLFRENRPNLAICIYHRSRDLIDIYQFLKEFEYHFYLRQHSASVEETVLYAVR